MNLSELIRHHKGDRSFDDLAKAGGGVVTSQRLQQMATTRPAEFPKPKGIRAIAKALGVREWVVVMAASESLGLDVARQVPRLAEVLPAAATELDDEQIAAITHVIRAFKREDVMGNAEHPAPTIAWAATVVIWVDQIVHQAGRPIPAELRRARNILAHSQLDEADPELVMSAFKLAQTELEVVLAELTATLDPPTSSRLGAVIGQGDLDEALDEQPPEDEDPATIRGGIEADRAARGPADS